MANPNNDFEDEWDKTEKAMATLQLVNSTFEEFSFVFSDLYFYRTIQTHLPRVLTWIIPQMKRSTLRSLML
jgi:hypothetical protein